MNHQLKLYWVSTLLWLLYCLLLGSCSTAFPCAIHNISGNTQENTNLYRPYKLLVSTTSEYFPVFLNWLIFYHNQCSDFSSLYIICLDKKIEEKLPKYGLKCSFVHFLPNDKWAYNRLWQIRAQVTKQLIDAGYDVLLSDSDALWLRNPFPDLDKFQSSHIIATRAKFPEWIYGRIGSAICMGFIYVKASPLTSSFWGEFIDSLVRLRNPDDQRLINELVFRKGIRFTKRLKYHDNTEADTGFFRHDRQHIHITLLPQNSYRRACDLAERDIITNATILHCFTMKKVEASKESSGKRFGNWKLDPSWSKVPLTPNTNIETFLKQVTLNERSE